VGGGQQDVLRFDVAVHDSCAVGGFERGADLDGNPDRMGGVQRFVREQSLKVHSLYEFHHQEGHTAVGSHVEQAHDVRVGQLRDSAGLPVNLLHHQRVGDVVEDLDRHRPVESGVDPGPHRRRGAAAEHRVQLIPAAHHAR
jgi:hypothetical protein